MATLLESYYDSSNKFNSSILTAMPSPEQVWRQQELLYRIEILGACQMFIKTAPKSADTKELLWHYQLVDAYFQNLTAERRFGNCADGNMQKQRDTAHSNLLQAIKDYRKRFGSFTSGGDVECYKKEITQVVQIVLPAWIQYRQAYIEIS